jgi:hypothetical protein
MSTEKSTDLIGNRTHDLPACIVPQPTALPPQTSSRAHLMPSGGSRRFPIWWLWFPSRVENTTCQLSNDDVTDDDAPSYIGIFQTTAVVAIAVQDYV